MALQFNVDAPASTPRLRTRIVHAFTDDALGDRDATEIAEAIACGEISAAEATHAAIARAERVDPILDAIALRDFSAARRRASTNLRGLLAGVPTFLKDNSDMAGLPTGHGSLASASLAKKKASEPFVLQFLSTGVTVLGKTRLPEFGLNASTEFESGRPTRNPWNTAFSCGASSGGAAALVAAGVVPIAHANDGGGSTRIPAAACGLVGLKLTRGREVAARMNQGLPVAVVSSGVVTRSVRDTARFAAAVEQHRRAPSLKPIGRVEGPSARRLRVGVLTGSLEATTDAETRAAIEQTITLLTKLGHEVCETVNPVADTFVADFSHYWSMLAFLTRSFGKSVVGSGFDRTKLDPLTVGLARNFAQRWWQTPLAIKRLRQSAARYRDTFERLDVLLSPVVRHTTPLLGYLSPATSFDELFPRLVEYVGFTPLNNATGAPGIALPLARTVDGLPIGVHFSAAHGDERTLLELAFELEAAQPFARIQDAV